MYSFEENERKVNKIYKIHDREQSSDIKVIFMTPRAFAGDQKKEKSTNLELFRFSYASMRMYVSNIDGRVALVAPNASADPHAEAFSYIFLNGCRPLRQLRSFQPQSSL